MVLRDLLGHENCDVAIALNGTQGLAMAERLRPDLILLDVVMPDLDGFEVCRQVRANEELADIPIIMLTGHNVDESAVTGLQAGAEDVIGKPFKLAELQLRVRTILQLNRYKKLQRERARFEWVVRNDADGYVITSPAGEIVFCNRIAADYLGMAGDWQDSPPLFLEVARNHYDLVTEEAWQSWPKLGENAFLVRPESDEARALWLKVNPMIGEAAVENDLVFRIRDESQRILLGQNIWTFESLVAHKLVTPLNGLTGALDLLCDLVTKSDRRDRDIEDLLEIARGSVTRLNDTVQRIVGHFHRPASLSEFTGNLGEQVAAIIDQIREELELAHVDLHISEAVSELGSLGMRVELLAIILRELSDNARKFHPRNDPRIAIDFSADAEGGLLVSILDDGKRVPPEHLMSLRVPCFQDDRYFTGEVPGMGLGLPRVAAIVANHGGSLDLRNRDDRPGFVVELRLPCSPTSN